MFISFFEFFGQMLVGLFIYSSNLGFDLFFGSLFETFGNLVTNLLFDFVGKPGLDFDTYLLLNKLSTIDLYLDGDPERTIDAAQPADLLDPANMEHLDQPLFLLGHGVENPADGIHGDEEYLYIVELPMRNPFEEPAEWTVKVSGHPHSLAGAARPTKRLSRLSSPRQIRVPLHASAWKLAQRGRDRVQSPPATLS